MAKRQTIGKMELLLLLLLLYLNKVESWNRIWRNERLASMAGEFVVVVVDLDLGVVDALIIIVAAHSGWFDSGS